MALLLFGCAKNEKPEPKQQATEENQKFEKIPEQLKAIESNIEKLIKELGGPSIGVEEEKKEDKTNKEEEEKSNNEDKRKKEDENQEKQGEDEKGKSKEDEKQNEKNGQQKQKSDEEKSAEKEQQPPQEDIWQKIIPVIHSLHYQWNSYSPAAAEVNASKTMMDNFSNALNALTSAVESKSKENSLMAANQLYSYVPDFFSLYKTSNSPEIKRVRHFTRSIILNSSADKWDDVNNDLNNLKSSWQIYKNIVFNEHKEAANTLDYSIYELEKVVFQKNKSLIDLKGRVVMSNIEQLEKAVEKANQKKISQSMGQLH